MVDPRHFAAPSMYVPGLKPPADDGDPFEVDAFNAMIRELRDQDPGAGPDAE